MAELLPEKRLIHCLGVERAAIELAMIRGDAESALAGLLLRASCQTDDFQTHDYQLDPDQKLGQYTAKYGMVGIYKIQEDPARF